MKDDKTKQDQMKANAIRRDLAFAGVLEYSELRRLDQDGVLTWSERQELIAKLRNSPRKRWTRMPEFHEWLNMRNDGNMDWEKFLEIYPQTKESESYERLVSECLSWERGVFDEITGGDYWLTVDLMLTLYEPDDCC